MAKIIAIAENYAYGPVGKLLTVTKELLEQGHSVTFIGSGTAYQLGSKEPFTKIIQINTNSDDFQEKIEDEFKNADFLLSCMDRSSVILAKKLGVPVIWLDTLFWWYDVIENYMLDVDCYIKQNTLKDDKNMAKYGERIKNLFSVGPIVDLSPLANVSKKKQVMIAYGGMEGEGVFKVGVDSHYPYVVTDLLIKKVDFSNYDRVLFTGNERVINELKEKYENEKFHFTALPHKRFIQELADSELSIMVPGLETPLEAFSYNVPTIFLPPLSSSQYVQLDDFIDRSAARLAIHFADYYPRLKLEGKSMSEMLKLFLDQLHIFEKDDIVQVDVAKRVTEFMNSQTLLKDQVIAQQKFIESLNGNGTQKCLEIINSFIEQHNFT